jgi:hypothetical protein
VCLSPVDGVVSGHCGSACYVFRDFTKTGITVRRASGWILTLRCCLRRVDICRRESMVYRVLAILSMIQARLACINTNTKVSLRPGK